MIDLNASLFDTDLVQNKPKSEKAALHISCGFDEAMRRAVKVKPPKKNQMHLRKKAR